MGLLTLALEGVAPEVPPVLLRSLAPKQLRSTLVELVKLVPVALCSGLPELGAQRVRTGRD